MLFAIDLHEDFIDEEGIAVAMMLSLQSPGEPGTELDTPEPNGFVGDCDASLSKQIFDITVAEVESEVKPDCIADDLRWEPVTFVDIHSGIIHFRELSCQYALKRFERLKLRPFLNEIHRKIGACKILFRFSTNQFDRISASFQKLASDV